MKKCFIICPIGEESSSTREKTDTLYKHILSPICKVLEYEAIRIDKLHTNGNITDEILNHLKEDELVIADLSESNPNAFYEIGWRSAIGKSIIHIKSKDAPIPFDVSHIRALDYDITDLNSVEEFKERLSKTISALETEKENNSLPSKPTSATSAPNVNSQILQEVYGIQDGIKEILESLKHSNDSIISLLADKLTQSAAQNANKSPEVALIENILPALMQNPQSFLGLIETINKLENPK